MNPERHTVYSGALVLTAKLPGGMLLINTAINLQHTSWVKVEPKRQRLSEPAVNRNQGVGECHLFLDLFILLRNIHRTLQLTLGCH